MSVTFLVSVTRKDSGKVVGVDSCVFSRLRRRESVKEVLLLRGEYITVIIKVVNLADGTLLVLFLHCGDYLQTLGASLDIVSQDIVNEWFSCEQRRNKINARDATQGGTHMRKPGVQLHRPSFQVVMRAR